MKFRISTIISNSTTIGLTVVNPMIRVRMTGTSPAGADSQNIHIGLTYFLSEADFLSGKSDISRIIVGVPYDVTLTYTQAEMITLDTLVSGTFSKLLDDVVLVLEGLFGAGNASRIM